MQIQFYGHFFKLLCLVCQHSERNCFSWTAEKLSMYDIWSSFGQDFLIQIKTYFTTFSSYKLIFTEICWKNAMNFIKYEMPQPKHFSFSQLDKIQPNDWLTGLKYHLISILVWCLIIYSFWEFMKMQSCDCGHFPRRGNEAIQKWKHYPVFCPFPCRQS